jgi:hypothetical protein
LTLNDDLDLFSHTINPILGLLALLVPLRQPYRGRLILPRYYAATLSVVAIAYGWMYFERKYQWWEHVWGVTFSTHTAVHVAILSALWQLGARWRIASILIGCAYALLIVYRHYHAPWDIALTAVALLPEIILGWRLAQVHRELPPPPQTLVKGPPAD